MREGIREGWLLKPGLTGLLQVSGRSDIPDFEDMKLDLEHIDKWSFWIDVKILLKTQYGLWCLEEAQNK